MRLWSIHPKYLDAKGIVALWREGLLAQKVLSGKTKGYRRHPQLIRFRETRNPVKMIGIYLFHVAYEAEKRGYQFDRNKILYDSEGKGIKLVVTNGQVEYELHHLLKKLETRDTAMFKMLKRLQRIRLHPLFQKTRGKVAEWERV